MCLYREYILLLVVVRELCCNVLLTSSSAARKSCSPRNACSLSMIDKGMEDRKAWELSRKKE